jgi:4-hydroxy-tetrahydrodipicolinate reductase
MKATIHGAGGRMGRAIVRLCSADPDISVVGAVDGPGSPHLGKDVGELAGVGTLGVEISADLSSALLGADVLIDFSIAAAFDAVLRAAVRAGVGLVSGTTRLSDEQQASIEQAAEKIAILWAPNMSVGVQVLALLVRQAVAQLPGYDVEVVETHHNQKADAPSGTATFLVKAAQDARADLEPVHGREGQPGARKASEIGVHALRGGGIVGDHSVHLVGAFDRLEITHRAMDRDLFADGAVRAARFIVGSEPGRYQLNDTL